MSYLHILSESDNDDIFYQNCLERLTGRSFQVLTSKRLRKSGGSAELRKNLGPFFRTIKYTGEVDDTFFLVVHDNDRSPVHPNHKTRSDNSKLPKNDRSKTCQYCDIQNVVQEVLGVDERQWPIKGAIAVPVEMIESWQLLICNGWKMGSEQSLPIFSKKTKSGAKFYYGSSNPPDQLKDLVKKERMSLNLSPREFCAYCGENLDVNDLRDRSPSFNQFAEQVADW